MSRFVNVTFGYEMDESTLLKILSENCMKLDDFESEQDAYVWAVETLFNYGCGCTATISD